MGISLCRLAAGRALVQSAGMSPDDGPSPEQLAVLRRMTPEQRWRAAHRLYWTLRRHKAAFLRHTHPEWSEAQLEQEVRRSFLHARS